jgi:hypothetical protein
VNADKPLLMIVPTRSRPQNVEPVVTAWLDTGGFLAADLQFAVDVDDPTFDAYQDAMQQQAARVAHFGGRILMHSRPTHAPLVPKLNDVATLHAQYFPEHRLIGFAGDDHLPRTPGWAERFVELFDRHGRLAVAYPDDGYQHEKLASSWVMAADVVRALGRMVPAPVDHLYCDNAVMDVAQEAGGLAYVYDVLVEHMHPVAGKTQTDEQYERVNGRDQYRRDRPAYKRWKRAGGLAADADIVRGVIEGRIAK